MNQVGLHVFADVKPPKKTSLLQTTRSSKRIPVSTRLFGVVALPKPLKFC